MQEVLEKITKGLYVLNGICALLMACCLDSESLVPAYILTVNVIVLFIPLLIYEVRQK